jgi:hypothetical protein
MFAYCLLQGLPSGVTIYFLQYFLQDVIEKGPEGYDLSLLGLRYNNTKSAESATALVNIATSWSQLLMSLVKTHHAPLCVRIHRVPKVVWLVCCPTGWRVRIEPDRSKGRVGVLAGRLSTLDRLPRLHVKLQ